MAKLITEYEILISCPGDVDNTVPLIENVLQRFNNTYTDVLAIRLNPKHWSTSSYNQSGGKPQDLLNKQFVHACDAAIAIFWARFGTPTDRFGSGAEEEIEDMLSAGKQVFMYFCEKPIEPKLLLDENIRNQYQKVQDFKQRYKDEGKGIFDCYSSDDEFERKLFAHISQHFLSLKSVEAIASQRKSALQLKGIVNGRLCDYYSVECFQPNGVKPAESWLAEIKELFSKISSYSFHDKPLNRVNSFFFTKVVLKDGVIKTIEKMAHVLEIELPEYFFALGELSEEPNFSASLLGGKKLNGTKDEIDKYNEIMELYESIHGYIGYSLFESEYAKLYCTRLAISNMGTAYDDDIDISLKFPLGTVLQPHQLPELKEYSCERMMHDYSIEELFGIPATPLYNSYDSSISSHFPTYPIEANTFPFEHDYVQEFNDAVDSAFDYGFFEEKNGIIVNLHIDYLKHNTTVAFPTVLFVTEGLTEIRYTIRSKQNESEINGVIRLGGADET